MDDNATDRIAPFAPPQPHRLLLEIVEATVQRFARARHAFQQSSTRADALRSLLFAVLHWCSVVGVPFDETLELAREDYRREGMR